MRSRERPSYLRLVTEAPPEPVFDWQKIPGNLAETVLVSHEILAQSTHLTAQPELATNYERALENLIEAIGGEGVGLQIAEHPVSESFHPVNTIFDQLQAAQNKINAAEFPRISELLFLATEKALTKITALAERSTKHEYSQTNPAFQKVLRIYHQFPQLRKQISEQLPQPENIENTSTWKIRAKEQAEVDAIGEKLKKCTNTAEILARLYVILGANPVYFNGTLYSRRLLRPFEIIRGIIDYVKSTATPSDSNDSVVTKAGVNILNTVKSPLPTFGDFKTAAIVVPEITKEFELFNRLLAQKGKLSPSDCNSWPALVWLINAEVDPQHTFTFTKHEEQVDTIHTLKGKDVIIDVENASFDKATIYELPDALTTGYIKAADAFLIELRTRLQEILDT